MAKLDSVGGSSLPKKPRKVKRVVGPVAQTASQVVANKPPSYMAPPKASSTPKSSGLKETIYNQRESAPERPALGEVLRSLKPELQRGVSDPGRTEPERDMSELFDLSRFKPERENDLDDFLGRISPKPEGYDPAYGGPLLPDRFRRQKDRKGNPYDPIWTEDYVANMTAGTEPGSSFEKKALNDVLSQRLFDQSAYVEQTIKDRADKVADFLYDAADDMKDGKFDTLAKKLAKNPEFLEFHSYGEDYDVNPERIYKEWVKSKDAVTDPYMSNYIREEAETRRKHYTLVRDYYRDANEKVREALQNLKETREKALDYQELEEDEVDPLIPKVDPEEKLEAPDLVGRRKKPGQAASLLRTLGNKDFDPKDDIRAKKDQVKKRLGVKELPSVREMLAVQVAQGVLDPDDSAAVAEWVDRLENPNHPITRALYYGFAKQVNPKLDDKKDGVEFVNNPVDKYIESENKRLKGNAEYEAKEQARKESDEYDLSHSTSKLEWLGDRFEQADQALMKIGNATTVGGYQENTKSEEEKLKDEANSTGALGQVIDLISRTNYAVAGAAEAWYEIDKDESPWIFNQTDPLGRMVGKSTYSPMDEVVESPSKLGAVGKAAYQQFFRGSNLPGTEDDIIPTTWGHVIAQNALKDSQSNVYDEAWYQNLAGFVLDVGTDPLNLVGIGVIDDVAKLPKAVSVSGLTKEERIAELSQAEVLKNVTRFDGGGVTVDNMLDAVTRRDLGPVAEKAARTRNAISRLGDPITGSKLVVDTKYAKDPVGYTTEKVGEGSYITRATQAPVFTMPKYIDTFPIRRDEINHEIRALQDAKQAAIAASGAEVYMEGMTRLADEMAFNLIVPELRASELKRLTATPVHNSSGLHLSNGGGKLYDKVIKPLTEGTVLDKWPGLKTTARYAETTRGQEALNAQKKIDELTDSYHATGMSHLIETSDDLKYYNGILDDALKVDEVTGKPSLTFEDNVEDFIEAGAPGLIGPDFDLVGIYAKASGMPKEEFAKIYSETDIIKSLWSGPKKAASTPEGATALKRAMDRVSDSKAKIARAANPGAKAAAEKALAIAYNDLSALTVEGSMRYLDELKVSRDTKNSAAFALEHMQKVGDYEAELSTVNNLLKAAQKELTKDYSESDEMLDFIDSDIRNGSYENADFRNVKSLGEALALVDRGLFRNKTEQIEALIKELTDQRAMLKEQGPPVVSVEATLNMPTARSVERMLPVGSSLRKANGQVDADKIRSLLKFKTPFTLDDKAEKGIIEVSYRLPALAKPANLSLEEFHKTAAWADHVREKIFMDNVSLYVQGRANTLYEQAKTKAYFATKEAKAADDIDDRMATFWTYKDNTPVGPAERRLGPRPTQADLAKQYPNTFKAERKGRVVDDAVTIDKESRKAERIDPVTGSKTAGQKRIEQITKREQAKWDKAVARAREIDKAEFKKLKDSKGVGTSGYVLSKEQAKNVYATAQSKALEDITDQLNKGLIPQTRDNARLPLGDVAAAHRKQIDDELRYEKLQLQYEKASATNAEQIRNIEIKRRQLETKRRNLYGRIKRIKHEANATSKVMARHITEEHTLQVLQSPARVDARVLQLRVLGMRKNLMWTNSLFRTAEIAEQFIPTTVFSKFANNFMRPTNQFTQKESIAIRARWESKTPLLIKAHLSNLTDAMGPVSELDRKSALVAMRRGLPYNGKNLEDYEKIKRILDDVLDTINGSNEHYHFKKRGQVQGEALSIEEIGRFLPEEYSINEKALLRAQDDRLRENGGLIDNEPTSRPKDTDVPFSPHPEPTGNFTLDDLMTAIERNGKPNPKDLNDPFRLAWVMTLAADQASQLRSLKHTMGETFGVPRPVKVGKVSDYKAKLKVWRSLQIKHGWQEIKEVPGYMFPPESFKDINALLEMTKPGKQASKTMQTFDTAIGYWKQGMTIYNPAYYTRNGIGEMMVSWLDGVNHPKWYKYAKDVTRYMKGDGRDLSELIRKFDALDGKVVSEEVKGNKVLFTLNGGLKVRVEDVLKYYIDNGLTSTFVNTDLAQGTRGLANEALNANPVRKGVSWVNRNVHEVGEGFEDWLRLAHFMHAMEHSGKGSLAQAAEYAASRVRRSHFDYTDFSKFEKAVMLRAFPFYKWIRRGAPLMLAHLFMTPGKMAALPKALDTMSGLGIDPVSAGQEALDSLFGTSFNDDPVMSTQDVMEDKNGHLPDYSGIAPAWVRDLFAYQMQPAEDDEYANFLRISTPQIDGLSGALGFVRNFREEGIIGGLAETTAYPLLNPAIKAPIELGMNKTLDPDSPYEIYGGEYNQTKDINNAEAIGSYLARQANPWTSLAAKLSKHGKLPVGNIADEESNRDASRDLLSFITGVGLYQGKMDEAPKVTVTNDDEANTPAVGRLGLEELKMFTGAPAGLTNIGNETTTKKNSPIGELLREITEGSGEGDSKGKSKSKSKYKKRKWKNYGKGRGGSGSSSSSFSGFDLLELIKQLSNEVDQGDVIDPDKFKADR